MPSYSTIQAKPEEKAGNLLDMELLWHAKSLVMSVYFQSIFALFAIVWL